MIRNDEEFKLVREQLGRAEGALLALRNDILPVHKERFALMGESYVAMIRLLREQLDEYLGVPVIDAWAREQESTTSLPLDLGTTAGNSPSVTSK
jgi:hypothetical protein